MVGEKVMSEVLIDLRKYDLADRLNLDMISVESLLSRYEDALNEIEALKEELNANYVSEPDAHDEYIDRKLCGLDE